MGKADSPREPCAALLAPSHRVPRDDDISSKPQGWGRLPNQLPPVVTQAQSGPQTPGAQRGPQAGRPAEVSGHATAWPLEPAQKEGLKTGQEEETWGQGQCLGKPGGSHISPWEARCL